MILIVNTCKERLSETEFVLPIIQIAEKYGKVKVMDFARLSEKGVDRVKKVIISGTALKDFEYLNYLKNFDVLLRTKKPILGICAGAQIIGKFFGCELRKKVLIGRHEVRIVSPTPLSEQEKFFAYFLFSKYVVLNELFESLGFWKRIAVFFKHKRLPIYATLFHPEVYNQDIIESFLEI